MKLTPNRTDDFGYLYIEDLYSDEDLIHIWNEISHIDYVMDSVFDDEEKIKYMKTHNVTDDDGELIMSGFGIGLDRFYSKREYSAILNSNRKIMQGDICDAFKETHPANVCYPGINQDFSLLNKYVPGQKYEKHRDSCSFSALTFFSRGNLEGGELEFSDYDIKFECKDNSCIIFPSWVYHSATEVKGGTRYSLAQFMVLRCYPPVHKEN